jgi:hypothetical protein
MAQAMKSVTDVERGGFSSNKFFTFIKNKYPELEVAFKNNPQLLQEIRHWNTVMRILPDAPSVNPSGTAKTVMHMMKDVFKLKNISPWDRYHIWGICKRKVSGKKGHKLFK